MRTNRGSRFLARQGKFLALAVLAVCTVFAGFVLTQSALQAPAAGGWAATGSMAQPRAGASAALLADGRFLVTGGADGSGPVATAEVYSVAGSFLATAPMSVARQNHISVTLNDGRVLVAGGTTVGGGITNSTEI